ncbi:MAG: glucosidase [Planctomycetota bacterium]
MPQPTSKHPTPEHPTAEHRRLADDAARQQNWKRWGPYLSERQWGTVREDYSPDGEAWQYFSHDEARSRAYRWGEDGLLGFCDRQCRLCFSLALWNGRDSILKERLFGLTGPQGNHGEDVKECYYYLDSTPTHSYAKALYRYPQAEFPYRQLVEENGRRDKTSREFELTDTGVFDERRYFDVVAEYAKAGPNDLLIRTTITNRGPEAADAWLLPTLWFRNTWVWGCRHEGCTVKPTLRLVGDRVVEAVHESLGTFHAAFGPQPGGGAAHPLLFTENETNSVKLYDTEQYTPYVKDAFHRYVIEGETAAVNPKNRGTKVAGLYRLTIPAGESVSVDTRLAEKGTMPTEGFGGAFDGAFGGAFDEVLATRRDEADAFYDHVIGPGADDQQRAVSRQAHAGLNWTKQFYHYVVADWLDGDEQINKPPPERRGGRNSRWGHVYARDVLSMPDKWEYPWFAAWDLAFHMIPHCRTDPAFAKKQLLTLLREWYMHPNGQMPAYEFAFYDVNPPVHAWACLRVFKMTGGDDHAFLAKAFQRLLLNFTWWVNRVDENGDNVFAGGFLGLDNIGLFDRSKGLPPGTRLEQADGTAWMAFYSGTMMSIALELAVRDASYEDMASKFLDHFVRITDAINTRGGAGLWDQERGFYFDQLHVDGRTVPLRVRSLVGLLPLIAVEVLQEPLVDRLPAFKNRLEWFMKYRHDLTAHVSLSGDEAGRRKLLLSIATREKLERVLRVMLDETEFLSPFGVRSLSKRHESEPFELQIRGQTHRIAYVPGESDSLMFGGNSNWRGPIWMPTNYLLIEALERYHEFYGDSLKVECPSGSGAEMNLAEVAGELNRRLTRLFLPGDAQGHRPCHGQTCCPTGYHDWHGEVLFHEYFNGDTGEGLGASHQTGWTALIANCIEKQSRDDSASADGPATDGGQPAASRRDRLSFGAEGR